MSAQIILFAFLQQSRHSSSSRYKYFVARSCRHPIPTISNTIDVSIQTPMHRSTIYLQVLLIYLSKSTYLLKDQRNYLRAHTDDDAHCCHYPPQNRHTIFHAPNEFRAPKYLLNMRPYQEASTQFCGG